MDVRQEGPYRFRIERSGAMRVPGVVFASRDLLPDPSADRSLVQVADVATLPGIVVASYAMPDVHWGYGFPVGGVAATDVVAGGVISPGGVGFDISCGVRMLAADLDREALTGHIDRLMDQLDRIVPRGLGRAAVWRLSGVDQLEEVLEGGAWYAVERGHGTVRDLERCEDRGVMAGATVAGVGARAVRRGLGQLGSLGSGNHFLEVQAVDHVYDTTAARAFGLRRGQVCVMIHCGSRGLGHQICTDHVRAMQQAMPRYGITVPDPQLACAPVESPEGRAYLGAMAAAANYGRANRQLLGQAARRAFASATGAALSLVYDISHNLAKIETHVVDGAPRLLCVHRKGAGRALPPGHPDLPADLASVGQPMPVPGTMGTASYVVTGTLTNPAFNSTCHGAGRSRPRLHAPMAPEGRRLCADLQAAGIAIRGTSAYSLAEQAPAAFKDIDAVVDAAEQAGLCRKIVRLSPLGVIKG